VSNQAHHRKTLIEYPGYPGENVLGIASQGKKDE
jgi:hypothetical protein